MHKLDASPTFDCVIFDVGENIMYCAAGQGESRRPAKGDSSTNVLRKLAQSNFVISATQTPHYSGLLLDRGLSNNTIKNVYSRNGETHLTFYILAHNHCNLALLVVTGTSKTLTRLKARTILFGTSIQNCYIWSVLLYTEQRIGP